jgi:chromosome transmission fidelity protein 1
MPYNMLLLDDLRNSLGIDLTNSVVIFDEVHNIVEAVNHIYSADVSYGQLDLASCCVVEYSARFQSTLTGKNYYYVNVLLSVINSLKHCLQADKSDCSTSTGPKIPPPSIPVTGCKVLGANDFLFSCGLDNVNMFKLRKHITETNLANKVGGYAAHQA